MKSRCCGILAHITSLPSKYGIGDLGPEAYNFIDFLNKSGQKYWQILPLNPIDSSTGYSPYSSVSAFANNTLLISPEWLFNKGYLMRQDLKSQYKFDDCQVHYDEVVRYKADILAKVFDRVFNQVKQQKEYSKFIETEAHWLHDYALYLVIKQKYKGKLWVQWPSGLKKSKSSAIKKIIKDQQTDIDKIQFNQYLFHCQWVELKAYCKKNGVQIIGDMPIYVSYDSVDIWKNQNMFKLDKDQCPVAVSGVPPDYFSADGQLWGNPVYDWQALKRTKFSWWVKRIRRNIDIYDYVRIDHFRGFVQYWEVRAGETTAKNGIWADVPTEEFLERLKKDIKKKLPIIAEDLGTITPDVKEIIRKYSLPGMKVLQFAFSGDLETHPYLPHNYEKNCIVYTGTHDNNTTKGWFKSEATPHEKENLNRYLKGRVTQNNVHRKLIRLAMKSCADTVIIPLQDYLGMDDQGRMNKPGSGQGNWTWRFNKRYISKVLINRVLELKKKTGR